MAYDFNANDIFEMAEQIERNGVEFYETAAKGVPDPSDKSLLLELAEMEKQHEKTFASMRADLTEKETQSTTFDPENEATRYLRALADMRVFYEKAMDLSSMQSVLIEAITAEKDSIVFYLGMKDLVPEKAGKERLDHIIKEEMGHITILAGKLSALK